MNKKHLVIGVFTASIFFFGCGGSTQNNQTATEPVKEAPSEKGVGKFTSVELTHPLDETMIAKGQTIYNVKCAACHKLTAEKLVGPGWKGVTDRRQPEWIMNFVTNTDEMLNKDANAQALLEVCMVRMPNQNLKDDEARDIVEFMRKNDGKN
jgi:mono/diheme cytochrome c family protein